MIGLAREFLGVCSPADRRKLALLLVLLLVITVMEMTGLGMFIPILAVIGEPNGLANRPWLAALYSFTGARDPGHFLLILLSGALVFYALKAGLAITAMLFQNRLVQRMQARAAEQLFEYYLARPYADNLGRNTTVPLRNVTATVVHLFEQVLAPFLVLLTEGLTALGVFTVLMMVNATATLAATGLIGGTLITFYLILRNRLAVWGRNNTACAAQGMQIAREGFGALKEIKVLGRERGFVGAFSRIRRQEGELSAKSTVAVNSPRPMVEVLTMAGILVLALVALSGGGGLDGVLQLLGVFGLAAMRVMPSLNRVINVIGIMRASLGTAEMVLPDLKVASSRRRLADEPAAAPLPLAREIRFDGVTYTYPGAAQPTIHDVSLTIGCGQMVAFVGASGAGKSTLADILLGLLGPDSGAVTVDGVDIQAHARAWQSTVGYVPQSIYLTDDTLKRNVAFGLPAEEIESGRVLNALRLASLDGVVEQLPHGMDTSLGENGQMLSGGQRQRVGIARALYNDAAVLLLDEATSALDLRTEREIRETLDAMRGQRTTVIIAHRLETIRHCDRLFLMGGGRLVAQGTFDELLAGSPEFRYLVNHQEAL